MREFRTSFFKIHKKLDLSTHIYAVHAFIRVLYYEFSTAMNPTCAESEISGWKIIGKGFKM